MTAKKNISRTKKTAPSEEKSTESDKTYRSIFEHSRIPTVVIGEDSTILLANSSFEELSGYSRRDIEKKKQWTEFVDTRDIEKTRSYITENLKPGDGRMNHSVLDLLTKRALSGRPPRA
jgi:PAS domain S-box-containing protein